MTPDEQGMGMKAFPPLHKMIEAHLISAAKVIESEGRKQTWAEFAKAIAAMPEIADTRTIPALPSSDDVVERLIAAYRDGWGAGYAVGGNPVGRVPTEDELNAKARAAIAEIR